MLDPLEATSPPTGASPAQRSARRRLEAASHRLQERNILGAQLSKEQLFLGTHLPEYLVPPALVDRSLQQIRNTEETRREQRKILLSERESEAMATQLKQPDVPVPTLRQG